MTPVLFGIPDYLITEDDADLPVARFALDRLETRFLRGLGVQAFHVCLESAHQEEDPDDHDRPYEQDSQEQALICGHARECRV